MFKDMKVLRKEVAESMAHKNISLRKLSKDTKLAPRTVRRFLNGEGDYYQNTVVKLCNYLGVDWQE